MFAFIKKVRLFLQRRNENGFSLVELLISTTIFIIITTIVLARNAAFNNSILLSNLAYEIALTIRQAQVYGVSVRGFDTGVGAEFGRAYGVHFDESTPGSFIFFADRQPPSDNDQYDVGQGEFIESFSIARGNRIDDVCATTGAAEQCGVTVLDITFTRPEPEATIKTNAGSSYESARIIIRSSDGNERNITVTSTGQISVDNP